MPLVLTLREKTQIPIEVDSIQMETVREQSAEDVARTLVQHGNQQIPLGEFFTVTGSASDEEMIWRGDCSKVKLIATYLQSGKVRVEGNAGMHLGAEMKGGEVHVTGNAADWVGAEMKGGLIRVEGDAGHLIGAVYRGGRRGMTGGTILIKGNAGNEIGHTMRRGLIAVGGRSGDAAGFNMIAGTLLLFGEAGIRPGAGMRRGTVCYFQMENAPQVLPTFKYGSQVQPVFLRFFLLELRKLGFPVSDDLLAASYHRYLGDFLEMGKGEILVRAA